jgi:uncharacterized protein YyaL (SSP411 family)
MSGFRPHPWFLVLLALVGLVAVGVRVAGPGAEPGGEAARTPSALPGAPEFPAGLRERLATALAARGEAHEPRTHHLRPDGSPTYTNRLILETSPYLLQHAHNPVNWYAWSDEAFTEAKRSGRPVLLSIGYSTCHWCHVMERESFEDEEIAAYMNANYVAIKVDREERPDLDAIYMSAVQMLTGRGGWPMTTWLTPEGEPFFGGTYFPARDGDRGTRKGFLTLLRDMKKTYAERPEAVAGEAARITERVRKAMAGGDGGALPRVASLDRAVAQLEAGYDPVHGGRRGTPKFPSSFPVRLLLSQYRRTGERKLREMAEVTLSRMAAGGIYDQIGGGFHRYSTDAKWLVPHFEKMLYDNALLAVAYLEGYQVTGREEFADVARDILLYVARENTSPEGAFYSATDADSLGPHGELEEGWFFTWTPAEMDAVLDAEDSRRVQAYYGVSPGGNFEGRSILHVPRAADEVARLLGVPTGRLDASLERARARLYAERAKRPAPLRDDKIVTSWNGLMIAAMARCGFVLDEPELVERGTRAADFLLRHSRREGRLRRTFAEGAARHPAFLDDYSFLIAALLDLYEADSDPRWLAEAVGLQGVLDAHYRDSKTGGFFMTADDHESLLAREKPARDGAEPSGNSVALMNLLRLHELTSDDRYRAAAEKLLAGFGPSIARAPTAFPDLLLALDFWLDTPKEIVIVTAGPRREADGFLDVLRRTYLPNKVVAVVPESGPGRELHARLLPLIEGKVARKGRATAYVCERGLCQRPTTEVDVFAGQLERLASAGSPATAPDGSP